MSKIFNIGDHVEVIDDNENGVVSKVDGDKITITFEDGFQQEFQSAEIIHAKQLEVDMHQKMHFKTEITAPSKPRLKSSTNYAPELDLHIHELIDDARNLSNFEILNIQLKRAKGFLDWAISKRFKKVILIHGIGQGVLKEELKTMLRRYDNVEFYDANYQKYGLGATEVRLY